MNTQSTRPQPGKRRAASGRAVEVAAAVGGRAGFKAIEVKLRSQLGRRWKVGDRLPPVKQLARDLGAGQGMTHRAVRALVSEGLLVSRRRAGTHVVQPTSRGSVLRGRTVAVLGVNVDFIHRMAVEFTRVVVPLGIETRQVQFAWDNDDVTPLVRDADAAVLFSPPLSVNLPPAGALPIVIVSPAWEHRTSAQTAHDLVSVDQLQGAALAGEHLRRIGCASACFVGRKPKHKDYWDSVSSARIAGFERGWGKPVAEAMRINGEGTSFMAGARGLRRYLALSPRPEAVFAVSDDVAMGFLGAAASHGLEAGRDYQLVGFDGQDAGQRMMEGPLTTVRVPAELMGRRAAQMLIDRLSNPDQPGQKLYLDCDLLVGRTTRTPPSPGLEAST